MANRRRGEVETTIAGRRYILCLTLGSLAELEHAFGVADLGALAERFAAGRLRADDLVRLLGCGLRGGGQALSDDDVRALSIAGSLWDVVAALAAMFEATFGGESAPNPSPPQGP